MSKWVLTIPFVAGEDKKKGLLRINNLMRQSAKAQGFESDPVKPKRPASQLWQQLESTGTEQRVTMEVIQPGQRVNLARARRTFTPEFAETVANYEFASGDDELDAVFQRIMPSLSEAELERMSNATSPRARAFDASIDSLVGADTKLRNRHINASDKFLKSYIIGHAPARAGATLTENRKRELQDIVKASLGNLGVMDDDMSELLRHRIQSRPILMNEHVEIEFRAMIHAYHEVRKNNASYIQAMMGGMDGARDPEGLISALLPSPDDIMRGAIAHLIIDLSAVPSAGQAISGLRGFVDEFAKNLFNLTEKVSYIAATDKQKSVGRLLAYHGGRKNMVRAVEKAVNKAQLRGADFIRAFRTSQPKMGAGDDLEAVKAAVMSEYEANGEYIRLSETNMAGEDSFFGGAGNSLFDVGESRDKAEQTVFINDMFKNMEKAGLAYPITQFKQAGQAGDDLGFMILPMELPRFTRKPIGWDRRWMVATMRVVDEYWDFIYSGEGILLSNLLYLIVARAEEIFQYTMDSTEITQLAILLSKDSSQFSSAAPAAPAGPAGPAGPVGGPPSTLTQAQKLKINRSEASLKRMGKPELQNLLDAMGISYVGSGARGRGGDSKATLVQSIISNRSRFTARRRSRRGGILPTPKGSDEPAIYRPLKTLSHLVTGQVAQAAAAVQSDEQNQKITDLEHSVSELQNKLKDAEQEAEHWKNETEEADAELILQEEHHDDTHNLQVPGDSSVPQHTHSRDDLTVTPSSTLLVRDEMDSQTFRDEVSNIIRELDELESMARLAGSAKTITATQESQVIGEIDKVKRAMDGDRTIFPSLELTSRILGPTLSDSTKIDALAKKVRLTQPKRRGRRKNAAARKGSRLGTIYTEVSVPRSRNTAKHIKTAMGELYADLYKTAKNDFKGADSVGNIGVEMINIGDDIFHLVAKADVMSDTKSNPPFGPFKRKAGTQEKIYAGKFKTLDEITRAMDKMARLFGWNGRFNGAYREGGYGDSDDEARRKITEIFYEIHDMRKGNRKAAELARDIELSLAALPNPPYDMEGYREEARDINRQEVEDLLERAFDPLLKAAQQQEPDAAFYKVKLEVNDPMYENAREILSRQGLLVSPRDFLEPGRVWFANIGGLPSKIVKHRLAPSAGAWMVTHSMKLYEGEGGTGTNTIKAINYLRAYTPRDFGDAEDAAMENASSFAGNYGRMDRMKFSYNDATGKGSIVMVISRPVRVDPQGNPPDTCCIICGSCDDPCDCENNPPAGTFSAKKHRKYKGHIIGKVSTGWMVEAYDQSFKTLKQARDFISKKVAGSATANQQCVRILKSTNRCKGMVVFIRSKKYKCDGCGAEYKEA